MSYFKIFNKDEIENNYQYRDGLNILSDEFEKYDFEYCNDLNFVKFAKLSDKIIYRNFYFTDVEHIFNFLSCDNDSHIREILLPDDYPEFKINKNLLNDNWKIKQIILGKRYELSNINTFKFLIEVGANVNASNDCALKWACYRGYFDIVKYLISEGANINSIDNSALFIASLGNQTNIVKYLIENGADVHVDDNALLIACEKGNLDIVKILVESGALSPSELAADKSNTSTDMYELNDCALSTSSRLGHLNIVKYLIESSTDVRFDSAIKRAFQGNQFDIVKYLVN